MSVVDRRPERWTNRRYRSKCRAALCCMANISSANFLVGHALNKAHFQCICIQTYYSQLPTVHRKRFIATTELILSSQLVERLLCSHHCLSFTAASRRTSSAPFSMTAFVLLCLRSDSATAAGHNNRFCYLLSTYSLTRRSFYVFNTHLSQQIIGA